MPGRWEKQLSFPLSGCLGYQKHLGRTGGYRLMVGDAYAFDKSILRQLNTAPLITTWKPTIALSPMPTCWRPRPGRGIFCRSTSGEWLF